MHIESIDQMVPAFHRPTACLSFLSSPASFGAYLLWLTGCKDDGVSDFMFIRVGKWCL